MARGVWAVVVAAGRGERFGSPKQFGRLGDARVVDRAVGSARATCDGVVLVLSDASEWDGEAVDAVVAGGSTRSESVRSGLEAIPDAAQVIVVHDAARPLAEPELFRRVIDEIVDGADCAVPGLAVQDTLARVNGAEGLDVVDRSGLVAVQTPQAFRASVLRAVHRGRPDSTDDAGLVAAAGGTVVVVDGDVRNRKITEPADLLIAEAILRAEAVRDGGPGRSGDAPL